MSSLRKRKRDSYWIQRRKDKDKINEDNNTTKKPNMIDVIPESLLLFEIFSKLRNPKDVIVCKSVSKKWNTLISSSLDQTPRSVLILNTHPQCLINNTYVDSWKGFELSKYIEPEFDSPVCVLASDKDILLCMKYTSSPLKTRSQIYIVNPVTMQWTRLPKTKDKTSMYPIGVLGNESMDRYYVVNLLPILSPSVFGFHVLDTKHGQWRHVWIEHPPWSESGWYPTQFQAVNFNASLHWLAHDGPIVGYNPNHNDEFIIIHRSQGMCHVSYGDSAVVSEILTVSKGHLRIIQLVCYPFPEDHHHLRMWTLVDYKQSKWRQEHDPLYFKDMISDIPWIQDYMQRYILMTTDKHSLAYVMTLFMCLSDPQLDYNRQRIISPQPLHCDPSNPLVVYLYLPESIVSLDVTTKKLSLITRVSNRDQNIHFLKHYDKVVPMTIQFDPTLVPYHERKFLKKTCR